MKHHSATTEPQLPPVHHLSVSEALDRLDSRLEGLSGSEAEERLVRFGANELQGVRPVSVWSILLDQLRSVVVLLLVAAAGVSVATGDSMDGAAIAAVLLINVSLGFATDVRGRRAMEALLRFDTPGALVVRGGQQREIDARELVPGDVIQVEAGRAVPADARVLHAVGLRVDEASLTGESLPVSKSEHPVPADAALAERSNMLHKGSTVAAGSGRAMVIATGMRTELGRIGSLVAGIREERTPLERRLDRLGRGLAVLSLGVGVAVTVAGMLRGAAVALMVETGIALAIAAIPEGLPAVATIALAVGVRRMARRNALVRRLPLVETLGSVTVICTDKTGTLTAGETTATVLWVYDRMIAVSGAGYEPTGEFREGAGEVRPLADGQLRQALRIGVLANRAEIERRGGEWVPRGDPTEAALLVLAGKAGIEREAVAAELPEVGEVPFSSERMLMATFHARPGESPIAYVKGAPRRILELSDSILAADGTAALDGAGRERIMERNRELAGRGQRVLALAYGRVENTGEEGLTGLTFVGLVGMIDPPAAGVKETIRSLRAAGIRTVMLTGDQQLTAEAVARELGILGRGARTLDGREVAELSEAELAGRLRGVAAFSRVTPDDKLKIVSAFRAQREIVGMLGDGVNDAAALKRADVGVAMGLRGTDVAKEVAAVVLQDDRFQTVAAAVEEGRVIFDNIRKFVFYLFSCNIAEVLVLLAATAAGLPLPLLPLEILWLNIVTDTFPALALALEPAEPGIMLRPPRDPDEAMLSRSFLQSIAVYGGLITAVSLLAFAYGLRGGGADPRRAQTLCFMTLALAQAFHLGNARSRSDVVRPRRVVANPYALAAAALVLALQLLAVSWTPLVTLLGTSRLRPGDWVVVLGLAGFPAVFGQGLKMLREARSPHDIG